MKTNNQINPFFQQVVFNQCFTRAIQIKTGQKFTLISQSPDLCWFLIPAHTLGSLIHRLLCVIHTFRITLLCYLVMYNNRFPLTALHQTQATLKFQKNVFTYWMIMIFCSSLRREFCFSYFSKKKKISYIIDF